MAYRFKLGERIDAGFVRIGSAQLAVCEQELGAQHEPGTPLAIHETRKALKRTRALLQLARAGLDGPAFRRENRRLRDIARLLSGSRDAHVIGVTLKTLEASAPPSAARSFAAAHAELDGQDRHEIATGARRAALRDIAAAREAFATLTLSGDGFDVLAPGLRRTYAQGREAFGPGHAAQSDEEYHEARKLVQQQWRQMALLMRGWPGTMSARLTMARYLSDLLGRDHDLAIVRAFAGQHLAPGHARTIDRMARDMQDATRARAAPLGHMLYAEKPAAFTDRLGIYWQAAQSVADEDYDAIGQSARADGHAAAGASDAPALQVVAGRGRKPARVRPAG